MSWLDDFVEVHGYGETPEKLLFWVGVFTIAGALRRKVWIDQRYFQWTPNFYLLIVGPPGGPKKSTAIGMGMRYLRQVPEIEFGPQSVSWQKLIERMAAAKRTWDIGGTAFDSCSVTIELSEFGSLFDPTNRELVDNLTDIWDGKIGTFKKETKTMGNDEVVNPWLNIGAGCAPAWIAQNFTKQLIGSGFASRPIFVYSERPEKDVAYVNRVAPSCAQIAELEATLQSRLNEYANLAGPFELTEEAYEWGTTWYEAYRIQLRAMGSEVEAGFYERKQTHLHKLAMVLCVARGGFPLITRDDLEEADRQLELIDVDVRTIFGLVGQSKMSQASNELLMVMRKRPSIKKKELFRRYFFRTLDEKEFEAAFLSVLGAGYVKISGPLDDPIISLIKPD